MGGGDAWGEVLCLWCDAVIENDNASLAWFIYGQLIVVVSSTPVLFFNKQANTATTEVVRGGTWSWNWRCHCEL